MLAPFIRLLFFLGCTAALSAQQGQIQAVIEEYENSVRANTMKIIEVKTEEEKARYRSTIPSAAPYATRVLALVQAQPGEPGNARGISWLITQGAAFPEFQQALALLGSTYADQAGIAAAVKSLEHQPAEVAEPLLQSIRQKNAHPEEKAAALYALGMIHFRQSEAATDPAQREVAKTKSMDLFQELVSTYPQVTVEGLPLADQAGRTLFEMSNLAVGSPIPEIEGTDFEGKTFKLSEYRGQRVVLFFWGDWCHACHGLIPQMNQFTTEMKDKPITVLGVNTDLPDDAKKAAVNYGVNFRNWSDGTTSGPITSMFNLRHFPTVYLIGPDGKIVLKQTSLEEVKSHLQQVTK